MSVGLAHKNTWRLIELQISNMSMIVELPKRLGCIQHVTVLEKIEQVALVSEIQSV